MIGWPFHSHAWYSNWLQVQHPYGGADIITTKEIARKNQLSARSFRNLSYLSIAYIGYKF